MNQEASRRITVLGVPDSAGAYCVGVEHAPAALRSAGLIQAITASGAEVYDAGDLTVRRWEPDRERPLVQNLEQEVAAVQELAETASGLLEPGARLVVLGGSCVVAVGMCAAMARRGQRPRLVYVDRHLDLNTPSSTTEGSLSWMGMAHALGVDGAAEELVRATADTPVLTPADLVYLGVGETEVTAWERDQVASLGLAVVPQDELVAAPAAAARRALQLLPRGPFVAHIDVDVLDFIDAPLAENVNGRNSGPTVEQLGTALGEVVGHPDCWGLSVGQFLPAHAAADPTALQRFVAALATAVS